MFVVETIARIRRAHFVLGQIDQGDLPGAAGLSENRPQGDPVRGNGFSL